jgi:imidazolonepropionase-like amidohydrolase
VRTLLKNYILIFLATVSVSWISNGHDQVPGAKQEKPILLTNGTIHTVTGATISNGQLLFDKGKIVAVSSRIHTPDDCEVIDIGGKHIYPGLISSISTIGLVEISSVRATLDLGELETFNSNLRAEVAINPDSEVIPVTRANGILSSHVIPLNRPGGLIAGQSAVVNLDGWTTEDMTLAAPIGMKISWPTDPQLRGFEIETTGDADARAYQKAGEHGKKTQDVDLRLEALGPVLNKEIPVMVSAGSARQIRDAVHWAQRENLKMILLGGADAWRLPELLTQNDIAVILGNVNISPRRRWESYDTPFRAPVVLHRAGVRFAIAFDSGGPNESNGRNLPYEAGKAVAFGLPKEEALKAITIYPAEILGVADRLGSLEAGKDATLIVTTSDPLDIRANVEMAFIEGRLVDLSSRHTQLYQKYQQRYQKN